MQQLQVRTYVLFALIAATAVATVYILAPFLQLLALALVAAIVLRPLFLHIRRYVGHSDALAATLTLIIAILFVAAVVFLFGRSVSAEAGALYTSAQDGTLAVRVGQFVSYAQGMLSAYVPSLGHVSQATVVERVGMYTQSTLEWLLSHSYATFTGAGAFLLNLLIFFMGLFYFLKDGTSLKRHFFEASPLTEADNSFIVERMTLSVRSIVQGMLLKALIQGLLAALGFVLFGIPNPLLWALAVAIASLVPAVGIALVYVPVLLFSFFAVGTFAAVGLLLWWVLLGMTFVDNILGPRLSSKGMHVHPLLVLVSALGGFVFMGPAGVLFGPLVLSFMFVLVALAANDR